MGGARDQECFSLSSSAEPKTSVTTRVSFQSRAKTELPFDGDVGNLPQQNQTSAEQPDPPDSSVNPPVCSNRKHSLLPERGGQIRNTRVSDGGTHVQTWFREVIPFSGARSPLPSPPSYGYLPRSGV